MAAKPGVWLYDRFVRFLDPGAPDTANGLLRGLSTNLVHARKRDVKMRIGAGSGVLVTDNRVLVASDVTPLHQLSDDVEWHGLADLTSYRIGNGILLRPPAVPFLFVAFGKKPDIRSTLRISVSHDVIEFCGDAAMTVRRRPVIAAYEALDGVPLAIYRSLNALVHRRIRDPAARVAKEAISKILDKQGDLAALALTVARDGPQRNTTEYLALSRLLAARDQRKGD